jgi:pyruvate dehydrogenase (quinone)
MSYADFARSIGLGAITVDTPDQLAEAWDMALNADKPTLLDVHCDPEMPPIPPHATVEQITSMTEAVLKGDPNAWHLLTMGLKTKAEEVLPSRR